MSTGETSASGSPAGRRRIGTHRIGISALAAGLVIGLGALAGPARADPVPTAPLDPAAPLACPEAVARADIVPGLVGEGWTVVRGSTPQPFRVEVLGVLTDGIGAGRDMVVIEISDLPGYDVVGDHGIWAGMSGSPVYVGGKLLGAVSYGFTNSPSRIGGLTPAADMNKLLGVSASSAARTEARTARGRISLTATERKTLSGRASTAVPGTTLERIPTPMSVSGLNTARVRSLQHEFDAAGRSVIAYAGSRASSGTTAAAPQAGGNFGAVATFGDFTIGGIGTTTEVCGDQALAFGHPMDFSGAVTFGAADASSLAIITDTSFGSFKMANLGGVFGTVDQDRLAGIRAHLGAGPVLVPVTTTIRNRDTSTSRTGTTQVAEADYLPLATQYGIWSNYDTTFDKVGRGLATSHWTITGTRAGGRPFSVSRSNTWSDLSDAAYDPAVEAAQAVDALSSNEFEPVTVTKVTFSSDVSSAYQKLRITKLAVSVNGGPYGSPPRLRVKAGQTIKLRVTVRGYRSSTDQNLVFSIKVPKNAGGRSGVLNVQGGLTAAGADDATAGCLLSDCNQSPGSLDAVIKGLNAEPQNNRVLVDLSLGRPSTGSGAAIDLRASSARQAPVSGEGEIAISVTK